MRIGLEDRISALMARLISLRNSRAPGTAREKEMHLFIFCYFISFALKNTKKKHGRYANTSNKNETIHY